MDEKKDVPVVGSYELKKSMLEDFLKDNKIGLVPVIVKKETAPGSGIFGDGVVIRVVDLELYDKGDK